MLTKLSQWVVILFGWLLYVFPSKSHDIKCSVKRGRSSLFDQIFKTLAYVITPHQAHLSKTTKHWDSFVSHCTYIPPNHDSALSYPSHVLSHIQKELSLHCYSGPFSCSRLEFLIGSFWTSPLGTVLKSHDSTERRIVQDLSFLRNNPSHSSMTSHININDFCHDWGMFNDVRIIVMDAPPSTKAATLDVDSAFRCCPILPSQQSSFVIHWSNSFFIDHNAPFGATSAGGVLVG